MPGKRQGPLITGVGGVLFAFYHYVGTVIVRIGATNIGRVTREQRPQWAARCVLRQVRRKTWADAAGQLLPAGWHFAKGNGRRDNLPASDATAGVRFFARARFPARKCKNT